MDAAKAHEIGEAEDVHGARCGRGEKRAVSQTAGLKSGFQAGFIAPDQGVAQSDASGGVFAL
jgi:hypothetical protein